MAAARPQACGREPGPTASHFHARVSPRRVYSRLSPELYQEGPAPGPGGRPALAVGGGLRASGRESAVPISADYRRPPPTRGREAGRRHHGAVRNDVGETCLRGRVLINTRRAAGRALRARQQPCAQLRRSWKRGRRGRADPLGTPGERSLPPAAPRSPCGCGPRPLVRVWSRGLGFPRGLLIKRPFSDVEALGSVSPSSPSLLQSYLVEVISSQPSPGPGPAPPS